MARTRMNYNVLHDESENLSTPVRDILKKAQKKLREIEPLKNKPNKTREEVDKLNMESYWLSIVSPSACDECEERKKKQLARHNEKEKKKEQKKEEVERKRLAREKRETDRELLKQKEILNRIEEEIRNQIKEIQKKLKEPVAEQIEREFAVMFAECKNANKVFRTLSLKYHPDKNLGNPRAEEFQILVNVRDKY
jgi:hypothetical protein